jgi:hypothetical protein
MKKTSTFPENLKQFAPKKRHKKSTGKFFLNDSFVKTGFRYIFMLPLVKCALFIMESF